MVKLELQTARRMKPPEALPYVFEEMNNGNAISFYANGNLRGTATVTGSTILPAVLRQE